jgi:DNA-binding NarL/FixJ family response regulator
VKVFVADNSAILRRQIIGLLAELRGVEIVGEARVAPEALSAIRERRPDVVTLDIGTGGGGGMDVLKAIKRDAPAPVVIVLTDSATPPYRKSSMAAGADFFLDKAAKLGEVREIIRSLSERFDSSGAGASSGSLASDI